MTCAGLVLAAGEGRRLGQPKALLTQGGQRLVDRAVAVLLDGGCVSVTVVAGAAPLAVPGASVVQNPDWASGMGSSLRVGLSALAALPENATAVAIVLVDQPSIGAEAVRRTSEAVQQGAEVAVATYAGVRGHPVVIRRSAWDEVTRLAVGDEGARAFMRAHPQLIVDVPCDDTGSADDVDTPDDLEALNRRSR